MVVIRAEKVGKRFVFYPRPITDYLRKTLGLGKRGFHQEFWALKDVNMQVQRGQVIGIIGDNGSGKSTLLRIVAGISQPTEGRIFVNGGIGTLLEMGAGFHPEFTGRENIYMNCLILGLQKSEIDEKIADIIDFSELGSFIERPVKTYSSGMYARLGFAIASSIVPDILLIDEVLAVGDEYFQRKCIEKIKELIEKRTTIVLVSHNMHFVRSLCNRAIWLKDGAVVANGDTDKVVDTYIDYVRQKEGVFLAKRAGTGKRQTLSSECQKDGLWTVPQRKGSKEAVILNVKLMDINGKEKSVFETGEDMIVEVKFKCLKPLDSPIFGVAIHRNDGVYCYGPNTGFDNVCRGTFEGESTYLIRYKKLPLLGGSYSISVAIFDKEHAYPYDWHFCMYPFVVVRTHLKDHGLTYIEHEWNIKRGTK